MENKDSSEGIKAPEFYNELGQVAEAAPAEELAHLEKPARDRELNLKKEAEEGLTAEQKKNIEIMEGLDKKYPHAFKKIDSKFGRFTVSDSKENRLFGDDRMIIMCKEGVFRINKYDSKEVNLEILGKIVHFPEKVEWQKTGNLTPDVALLSRKVLNDGVELADNHNNVVPLIRVDLTDHRTQGVISEVLKIAEEQGVEKEEREKQEERKLKTGSEEILANL